MELLLQTDDREVVNLFNRLLRRAVDLTPTMQAIGAFYERRVIENFKNQSAPDSTPWQPLSEVTLHMGLARNKGWKKNGYLSTKGKRYLTGKRILWEHGDLEGSVHSQASKDSVTIGAGGHVAPYAPVHQRGTKRAGRGRKVTIPAREYLAMNRGTEMQLAERDRTMVLDLIRERLLGP